LQTLEVVPLFGDMQIQPFSFVKKSPHYDASKWPLSHTESERCHVIITDRVRRIREDHADFITHLSRIHNEVMDTITNSK